MTTVLNTGMSFDLDIPRRGRRQDMETPPRALRVARLLALAIKFEGQIRAGTIRDYAELARLGHVSRARVTQIMDLILLAPDIQEEILFLAIRQGRDPISRRHLHPITLTASWRKQRRLWRDLKQRAGLLRKAT
jgi:hypothetical protein